MDDRLAQLGQMPKTVAQLVVEVSDEDLDRPGKDGWSARGLLAVQREMESAFWRTRIEQLAAGSGGTLHGFDPEAWRSAFPTGMPITPMQRLMAGIALQRQASIARLEELPDRVWANEGVTAEGDVMTLAVLLDNWIAADHGHLAALEETLGTTVAEVVQRRAQLDP